MEEDENTMAFVKEEPQSSPAVSRSPLRRSKRRRQSSDETSEAEQPPLAKKSTIDIAENVETEDLNADQDENDDDLFNFGSAPKSVPAKRNSKPETETKPTRSSPRKSAASKSPVRNVKESPTKFVPETQTQEKTQRGRKRTLIQDENETNFESPSKRMSKRSEEVSKTSPKSSPKKTIRNGRAF